MAYELPDVHRGEKRRHRKGKSQNHSQRLQGLAHEAHEIANAPSASASAQEVAQRLRGWRRLLEGSSDAPNGQVRAQRQVLQELTDFVRPPGQDPSKTVRTSKPRKEAMLPELMPRSAPADGTAISVGEERSRLREWGIDKAYARRFRLHIPEDPSEDAVRQRRIFTGCVQMMSSPGGGSPRHYTDHKGNILYSHGIQGASHWKW
eukprot:Hpha_TRINITY_DN14395_c0_g1::TRINITY_DN14395_c0_g1_i1::g.86857::m.86857